MFSVEILIIAGISLFAVGGVVGAVISRAFIPPEQQKQLEQNLQATQEELNRYQQEVAEHFAETSQLINNLTHSYRSVHEHLAKGALSLTSAEISQQMLKAGNSDAPDEKKQHVLEEANFEAPKDWAPKPPGQVGTLSEEFGLNDTPPEADTIESTTATGSRRHFP